MLIFLAGRTPLAGADPEPPALGAVVWNADRLPSEYDLVDAGQTYSRNTSSSSTDLRKWVQSTKVMTPADQGRVSSGYYWEIELGGSVSQFNGYHGVVGELWAASASVYDVSSTPTGEGIGYRGIGALWGPDDLLRASGLITYGAGDTIMLAYDCRNGGFWFGVNGVWDRDPATDLPRQSYKPSSVGVVATGQGRDDTSATGKLVSLRDDFTYAIPAGFVPLSESGEVVEEAALFTAFSYVVTANSPEDGIGLLSAFSYVVTANSPEDGIGLLSAFSYVVTANSPEDGIGLLSAFSYVIHED